MELFNKVAIIGVGLIGGSVALAIKKKRLAKEIVGVSRHKRTLMLAKKSGAIDRGSQDIHIIKDADLLILAVPVNTIMKLAPKIARIIKKDCLVTDVGSTKEEIVRKLDKLFPCYMGAHPLAGSEKRGITYAKVDIFKNSLCILTPTPRTAKLALRKIEQLWRKLGAKVVFLSSLNHDRVLSFVSHLPHIAAFSLIDAVPKKYLGFASTGLKDTTRIAASDSEVWSDIFLSNRRNIVNTIALFEKRLSKIKSAINRRDRKQLTLILKGAKRRRQTLG